MQYLQHPHHVPSWVWNALAQAMRSEDNIESSRTSAKQLCAVYTQGLATIALSSSKQPIGFIAAWPVEDGYVEIGSGWVHASWRGMGVGRRLYQSMNALQAVRDATAFAITKNPIALRAGRAAHLNVHTNWNDPVPWRLTCDPCTWVADVEKENCKNRNTTCWLRIRS